MASRHGTSFLRRRFILSLCCSVLIVVAAFQCVLPALSFQHNSNAFLPRRTAQWRWSHNNSPPQTYRLYSESWNPGRPKQSKNAATTAWRSWTDRVQFIAFTNEDKNKSNGNNPQRRVLRIPVQISIVLACYILHLTQLTQKQIVFPVQLIPNSMCHFTGIGLDSLAGVFSMALYALFRWQRLLSPWGAFRPSIETSLNTSELPWTLPDVSIRNRITSLAAAFLLVQTYFATGRFSLFWEDLLYSMSGIGFPITAPMYRSLLVLLGHLTWLGAGTLILRWIPRPPKFFGTDKKATVNGKENADDKVTQGKTHFQWFRSNIQSNWAWWVIGGYFTSSCLFNLADLTNQYILPPSVLEDAQESVVSQLVNPEHNDILASVVGYIAPCLTAPWWEEVLYRGFALPFLTQLVGFRWAVFLQGVIFSAHHMSITAALPLAVLGWIWALIYTQSQNLWVVMFIHSLWNSRVFFGSWLGL